MTSAGLSWWMVRNFYFRGVEDALSACMECDEGVPLKLFEDSKTEA